MPNRPKLPLSSVSNLVTRAAARWHLLVLFVLAFVLSLWWSDTGTESPRQPVFMPPPPSLVQARASLGEDAAKPADAAVVRAPTPVAPPHPQADAPPQHADGDNAPGIGLEPESEPLPE